MTDKLWLNLGCGANKLPPPWRNHDNDINIQKKLPWPNDSTKFILIEHVLEHLSSRDAWLFLEEARRILCVDGVIRIVCPSIFMFNGPKIQAHLDLVRRHNWGDGSIQSAIKAVACCHGHKTLWTVELLGKVLQTIGFTWVQSEKHKSMHPELVGVEGHWKEVGHDADIESIVVEGTKIVTS